MISADAHADFIKIRGWEGRRFREKGDKGMGRRKRKEGESEGYIERH